MRRSVPFPSRPPRPEPAPPPPPSRWDVLGQRLRRGFARLRIPLLVGAGMLMALAALFLFDLSQPPPQRLTQRDIDAAVARAMASATPAPSHASQAYQVIRPSLVSIRTQTAEPQGGDGVGIGSGVVVNEDGSILTSNHVVDGASKIQVIFADGTESEARVVATQPESDLALLRPSVTPDDLVPAQLAGSGGLNVGDEVVAVGTPFGIAGSLTSGVVSGLGREYRSSRNKELLKNLIQFDAAVNPGNSGGPLVNRDGEVVGIVTGLLNPTDQDVFIGIGFAVPIETAAPSIGEPPF